MYDSVSYLAVPADAEIVAGYVDGMYKNFAQMVARTPQAQHVSITVTGQANVMVADCETGDLTPSQAARWAQNELAGGRHPTIYCSRSLWEATSFWLEPMAQWSTGASLRPALTSHGGSKFSPSQHEGNHLHRLWC